ncbi:hypothetical protein BJF86_02550 [Serinicoccus sp. CNJ-927]|nr:hypothetical protein BJF86_02550 [Serinicoccus sp. CNJ-927]
MGTLLVRVWSDWARTSSARMPGVRQSLRSSTSGAGTLPATASMTNPASPALALGTAQVLLGPWRHPLSALLAKRTLSEGSTTDTPSGSSSVRAALNPSTPSIKTTSMPSRQAWSSSVSQP